jgi:DNA-binding NarL/FixJ family response regulator
LLRRSSWRVVECASLSQLAAANRTHKLDAVIVDLEHSSADVYSLVRQVRAMVTGRVVTLGTPLRQAAVDLDVDASVDGEAADVISALASRKPRRHRRTSWSLLTPRQRDVLRWLADGLDNKAIGRRLGVGERAVKAHVTALLSEFELDNRTQLALLASRAGYRPSLSIMSRRTAR